MEEALLKRVLPHSDEAEQSVIGSMLLDRDAVAAAAEILSQEDFYNSAYGCIFQAMCELFDENLPIDLVTLQNRLREKDLPSQVLSVETVREIMDTVPTSVNIRSYANIVKEKSVLRRLIHANEEIASACYAGKGSLSEILENTEKKIFDLLNEKRSAEFIPIRQTVLDVLERIEKSSKNPGSVTGIPTGFYDLDYKTSGMQPSDLVLIAARPSMGKTAFVLNLMEHVAVKKNIPCMIFSLEMSRNQLVHRLLSMESQVDSQKMRTGSLEDADWDNLVEGVNIIGHSKIIIDDTPGISVAELRSKCRKAKLEHGIRMIIIDYLQLMTGSKKNNDNRQQEISEISRSLKALAREMEAPVIALSQLSRACEQRPDHRPMLSDLRESGAIEQDADVVMFLYRDDYYHKDTETPNMAEVIIAKQRNGPIGTINLMWQPEYTRFVNPAK